MKPALMPAGAFDHERVIDWIVSVPEMPELLIDERHIEGLNLRSVFSREGEALPFLIVNPSDHLAPQLPR